MNYEKHYNTLIERAKEREEFTEGYYERHHIIPRCLGGTDDECNLVYLTPEEHYVAHQLLVKMYPDENGLVYAANMMVLNGTYHQRNNKRYGWLKRKYHLICKQRVGEKNGSYGRRWYHDPVTLESGKFKDNEVPEGWVKGRKPRQCKVCGKTPELKNAKYCKEHRNDRLIETRKQKSALHGLENQFLTRYRETGSINQSLKDVGLPGAVGGYYRQAKKIIDNS